MSDKSALSPRIVLLISCLLSTALFACQSGVTALTAQTPAQVHLSASTTEQLYSFVADPLLPTTLILRSEPADMPFTAELRDSSGQVVAALGSGTLQTATLTVAPGNATYQVKVASSNGDKPGRVTLSISTDQPVNRPVAQAVAMPVALANSFPLATACSLSTDRTTGVNIRSSPSMGAPVMAILPPNTPLNVDARSEDGWYRVRLNNAIGWVLGSVVAMNGLCSSLPLQASAQAAMVMASNPIGGAEIPGAVAPYDMDSYYFGVDQDSGGEFREAVSYPNGDNTDRILLALTAPANGVPSGRSLIVTLACNGNGAPYVRWGTIDNPALTCGASIPLALNAGIAQQNFVVTIPGSVGQSYVDYALRVQPVAPDDPPAYGLGLDKDAGGQMSEAISYPSGDRTDLIQMTVPNLDQTPANSYREFNLTLDCGGSGTKDVRWGTPDKPTLGCGSTVVVPFSLSANVQSFAVTLPEGSEQSYVNYTLRAAPAAPGDPNQFVFGLDRDGGGQLSESVSYPAGDHSDLIQMSIANLAQRPPNNFRQFHLTLYCTGTGMDFVRWGLPSNPNLTCGSTISTPFLYDANRLDLAVTVPDGSPQTYVSYTLVAAAGT
jgi:uncharacterized protein YraI